MRTVTTPLFLSVCLGACAVGPQYRTPVPLPIQEMQAPGFQSAALAEATADQPSFHWWREFADLRLDRLIAIALVHNRDIAAAQANLRAARAALGATRAQTGLQGAASAAVTTSRGSAAAAGLPEGTTLADLDLYDAGLDASWEIDLFGRSRRLADVARADADVEAARVQGVRLAVAAETSLAYLEYRGAQARLAVARANADNQQETFRLTQSLFQAGRVSALDQARAEGQLASTLASIPPIEAAAASASFRLGVLTGQGHLALQELVQAEAPLPETPPSLAVGDPTRLVQSRPDIVAAERALAASVARVGVSAADMFPRLSLIGNLGTAGIDANQLGGESATRFSLGPVLVWNWNIRETRAQLGQSDARADAALAVYEATVLSALEDVEGSLVRLGQERRRLEILRTAARANAEAARLSRLRYRVGSESFLSVLDAERQQLQAEDLAVQSQIEVARAYVSVHRALGAAPAP